MGMTSTMRDYGTAARFRAEAVGHHMKDRALEKRLDRTAHEAERLRLENQLLRDEVQDSRIEHHRILDLLEQRMAENVPENAKENAKENGNGRSHKARWMLILLTLGGGAFAIIRRMRDNGTGWNTGSGVTA
jgi:hypothetical protein